MTESLTGAALRRRTLAGFGVFGVWWGAWGALLPAVQRTAAVDDSQLGTALLFVGVGAFASMRVTGALIDRLGNPVLPVTIALFALSGVGPGLVEGMLPLATVLLVVGATSGAVDVALNAEASRAEMVMHRPLLNLAHAWFSLGVVAGSLGAGGLRAAGAGPTAALAVIGGAVVAVAAGLAIGVRTASVGPVGRGEPATSLGPWWRPPSYLAALGVLMALAFLIENAWQTWAAVHLERDLGQSAGLAAVGPALFGASAAAGRLLAHRLAPVGGERRVVIVGALIAAVGTGIGAAAPVTLLVLAGIGLAGLGTAGCAPSLFGLAGRSYGERSRGAAVGTVTTIGYLGFVLAPAFVGQLADVTTLPAALGALTGVALFLAAGALRLQHPLVAASIRHGARDGSTPEPVGSADEPGDDVDARRHDHDAEDV